MRLLNIKNLLILWLIPLSAAAMFLQDTPTEPIARLATRLARGQQKLDFDARRGYLPSLLKALNIPISTQALVFSKTSLQAERISPRRPRALYFNDDIYIGWIPDAPLIEIASVDPKLGTVFYTLEQEKSAARIERQTTECFACHAGASTGGVPGLIMRSVYPDNEGNAILRAGTFLTTDRSPWRERWGGWYVTGNHGDQVHMGNMMIEHHVLALRGNVEGYVAQLNLKAGANLKDVTNRFDSSCYLSPHSDIVALLVLTHQTNVHNLITRVNYETQAAIVEKQIPGEVPPSLRNAIEDLIRAMLFAGEPQLAGPVHGTSGFVEQFSSNGPRDRKGRSLRDLDLNGRLFRYPLSYLIYSDAFEAIPDPAKNLIYRRLREILRGKDASSEFGHLSQVDRTAILEILADTRPGW